MVIRWKYKFLFSRYAMQNRTDHMTHRTCRSFCSLRFCLWEKFLFLWVTAGKTYIVPMTTEKKMSQHKSGNDQVSRYIMYVIIKQP